MTQSLSDSLKDSSVSVHRFDPKVGQTYWGVGRKEKRCRTTERPEEEWGGVWCGLRGDAYV